MIIESRTSLANDILKCYEDIYNTYFQIVENIINNNIRDEDFIKDTLNHIIYIYTEKGFDLYMKLLFYYASFNVEATYKYIGAIKTLRENDYRAFVKKLEKQK